MIKVFLILLMIPIITYGKGCDIPYENIKVGGVSLGASVKELAKKHKAIEIDNMIINRVSQKEYSVFLNPRLSKDWSSGEPVDDFNYITYNKLSYRITSFGVSFNLYNLSPAKLKNTLIVMYDLPKVDWKYLKENDPKYGEAVSYTYHCSDYRIRISQSALGSSMQISQS